jgi:hypothetical protein
MCEMQYAEQKKLAKTNATIESNVKNVWIIKHKRSNQRSNQTKNNATIAKTNVTKKARQNERFEWIELKIGSERVILARAAREIKAPKFECLSHAQHNATAINYKEPNTPPPKSSTQRLVSTLVGGMFERLLHAFEFSSVFCTNFIGCIPPIPYQ